jgi:hypothetical protein
VLGRRPGAGFFLHDDDVGDRFLCAAPLRPPPLDCIRLRRRPALTVPAVDDHAHVASLGNTVRRAVSRYAKGCRTTMYVIPAPSPGCALAARMFSRKPGSAARFVRRRGGQASADRADGRLQPRRDVRASEQQQLGLEDGRCDVRKAGAAAGARMLLCGDRLLPSTYVCRP